MKSSKPVNLSTMAMAPTIETQPRKLADNIVQWCKSEFPQQTDAIMPSRDVLSKLCRANMIHIWNFLITNVHSKKYVNAVQISNACFYARNRTVETAVKNLKLYVHTATTQHKQS